MLQLLLATGGAAPHPGPHRIPLKKVVTARHELKAHPIADPDAMVEAWPSTAAGYRSLGLGSGLGLANPNPNPNPHPQPHPNQRGSSRHRPRQ